MKDRLSLLLLQRLPGSQLVYSTSFQQHGSCARIYGK